jgi:phosphoesterase RecJ-like protein
MVFSPDKIKSAFRLIVNAEHILITTHVSPDGDAIGSTLGFQRFLQKMGKKVTVITPNDFPGFLKWMPGADEIIPYEGNERACEEKLKHCDLVFALDYNDLKRLDKFENGVGISEAPKILIDHHEQPKDFAVISFSDTKASSTCQMVYDFISSSGFLHLMDSDIAACLYTGIMTDTGSFRFSCTSPHTHTVVAALLETGMDHVMVNQKVNDANTFHRLKLLGYVLANKLVYMPNYHCVYMSLTEEEMRQFNYQQGDSEGFVNYGLSVHGVKLSVLFKEAEGKVRMSLRSKGNFSVQRMAQQYFHGGGHFNASGGTSYESMEKTIEKFTGLLPSFMDELEHA